MSSNVIFIYSFFYAMLVLGRAQAAKYAYKLHQTYDTFYSLCHGNFAPLTVY